MAVELAVAYALAKNWSQSGDWLNEGTGGSTHDATITGATYTDAGAASYWTVDGNDRFEIDDNASLDFTSGQEFTVGIGCRADDWTPGFDQGLITKRVGGIGWAITSDESDSGKPRGIHDGSVVFDAVTTATPSAGADHTIILTLIGTTLEIYADGVASGSPTTITAKDVSNGGKVYLAYYEQLDSYLTGRVFSYAVIRQGLTAAQVGTTQGSLHDNLLNQNANKLTVPGHWGLRVA